MKHLLIALIGILAFAACDKPLDYVSGEILISFEQGVNDTEIETIVVSDLELTIQKWVTNEPDTKIVLVDVPKGEEQQWIETAESHIQVKYAELNGIVTID